MTPMGHSLIGLSFASLALSTSKNATNHRWRNCGVALTFVALANLPDWPLPNWGHDRYDVSHSIFVNAGLICTVIAVMKTLAKGKWFSQPRFLMLAAMLGSATSSSTRSTITETVSLSTGPSHPND